MGVITRLRRIWANAEPPAARLVSFAPKALIIALIALVLALSYRNHSLRAEFLDHRRSDMRAERGDFIPTFTTRATDGQALTVAHHEDSTARQVVFVLTSMCPYCKQTLPSWGRIASRIRETKTHPVSVIALTSDSLPEAKRFASAQRFVFPVIPFPERKLVRLAHASIVPQTLILNAEGQVIFSRRGAITTRAAEDSIVDAAFRVLPVRRATPKPAPLSVAVHTSYPTPR
jgi:cytochrome c biogenesis protein CcmG/thiol:disulfide interchange protein DsbE